MIDQQNCKVKNSGDWDTICPFPVGFIYLSSTTTSPADIYGGQWSALTDGRFLRPNGSWRVLGGVNSHSHWQSIGKAPGDSNGNIYLQDGIGSSASDPSRTSRVVTRSGAIMMSYNFAAANIGKSVGNSMFREDSTTTASNLPAYTTCYCWYRTA